MQNCANLKITKSNLTIFQENFYRRQKPLKRELNRKLAPDKRANCKLSSFAVKQPSNCCAALSWGKTTHNKTHKRIEGQNTIKTTQNTKWVCDPYCVKTRSNSFHSTLEPNTEVFSKVSRSLAQFTLVNSFSTLLNKGGSTCNCPSASQDF